MPGVPINSLEDLIMLQQIKNQNDPFRSGMHAIAQGVALGIEEKRQELKQKKDEEEQMAKIMKMAGNTNQNKISTHIDEKGRTSFSITPIDDTKIIKQQEMDTQVENIADGVIAGDIPPDLKGLYRYGGPVRAKLAEKGFDLTKATKEWNATQKYIMGINAPQQIRMRQALNSVSLSIPELRSLNEDFKRSGWTPANGAELKLALTGTDPVRRDAATKFIGQVNLMKDELAQAFMGGGVPTDRAFQLADDVLNPLYGEMQLNKAIDQLEFNLRVRDNAISSVEPVSYVNQPIVPPVGQTNAQMQQNSPGATIQTTAQPTQQESIPSVGQMFKGQKVKRVTRIK